MNPDYQCRKCFKSSLKCWCPIGDGKEQGEKVQRTREERLEKAVKILMEMANFYGSRGNWRWDQPNASDRVSIVDEDWDTFSTKFNSKAKNGGKRARKTLETVKTLLEEK